MPTLTNHSFTVILAGVDRVDEDMAERIYGAIDDALLSSSNGEVRLEFDRDAASPLGAIASAVRDIRGAGYSVRAISPPPTLEAQWVDSSVTDTTDVPRTVECSQSGGVLVRIRDALLPDQTISTSCPDIKELSAAYG